ncbi:unnamed protein product [Effrenium voratum]|nr:unnamed protein product [Effrenium voratum]
MQVCTFRREKHSFGLWLQEEAAQDLEEALQEEKHQLQKEAEQFDADLLWLESSVDEATQAWREAPSAQMMLEAQEAESMRQAQEAEAHLASLGRALAKELQKHREANRSLQGAVESEELELEGYIREEKVEQDTWDRERHTLAEEAGTVAAELQRLASGLA